MAKGTFNDKGLSEFIAAFGRVREKGLEAIAGEAIYEEAKVVADQVKQNLLALQTSPERYRKTDQAYYLSPRQKQGLVDGFGIAPKRAEGNGWNVRLGFWNYNKVMTDTYPGGQPNAMIARTVESGSTYMIKQPFFRSAVNASKGPAKQAGTEAALKAFERIMGK